MKKYFITLAAALLFLQGCSNKKEFTTDQLQNLTNSVKIESLEKSEFNTSENRLIVYTNEELVSEEQFNNIIKSLSLSGFNGKNLVGDNINSKDFDSKDFGVEVVSKNKNSVVFNIADISKKTFNIKETKYSEQFVKNKIAELSKSLITFNELAGTIEIDLKKGNVQQERVTKFNNTKQSIENQIVFLKSLNANNTNYNLEKTLEKINRVEVFIPLVSTAVDTALTQKQASYINNTFLNINEIDKIAREL